MKPSSEWGPADHMAWSAQAGIVLVLVFVFGVGAASTFGDQIRAWKHDVAWNKRGVISCERGAVVVANIDFSGEWSGPVIDMDMLQRYCQPAAGVSIETYR